MMGTRCLTVVKNERNEEVLNMYRQFDGYPDGHGLELAGFLADMLIVNGMSGDEPEKFANGMGCLAAQIVANFKTRQGGIYLNPALNDKSYVSYIYTVTGQENDYPKIKCQYAYNNDVLFDGYAKDFDAWVNEPEPTPTPWDNDASAAEPT